MHGASLVRRHGSQLDPMIKTAYRTARTSIRPGALAQALEALEALETLEALELAGKNLRNTVVFLVKNALSSFEDFARAKPASLGPEPGLSAPLAIKARPQAFARKVLASQLISFEPGRGDRRAKTTLFERISIVK